METILRPMAWDEFPVAERELFARFRNPGVGETMILEQNMFIEGSLGRTVATGLADHIAGLDVQPCGLAGHHAPEDQPDCIGAALVAWIERHGVQVGAGVGN
jgi:hypothetical protein